MNKLRRGWDGRKADLEKRLASTAAAAAKEANAKVLDVEFDLGNCVVRVNTAEQLPRQEKKVIRRQVLDAIAREFRIPEKKYESLKVDVRLRHPYPYTVHSVPIRRASSQFGAGEEVHEVSIKTGELKSLREAYEQLRTRAKESTYVVTCARGGLPAINYVAAPEHKGQRKIDGEQERNDSEELAELKEKYNVFPGLNWDTPALEAKKALSKWLDRLKPGSSLLFFDTGSEGNGARRFFNFIVDEYVPKRAHPANLRFLVLGVVDESTKEQKEKTKELVSRSGEKSVITIDYIHVDWVFTEDAELLLGYDLFVHEALLQPAHGNVCAHLVDEKGRSKITLGTTAASAVLNLWLKSKPPLPARTRTSEAQSTETSALIAEFVCANAYNLEKAEIQAAAACGLVDEKSALNLLKRARKKFALMFARLPKQIIRISKKRCAWR